MMTAKQEELSKIACVPKGESTKDFPEIMDADGVLSYPTLSNGNVTRLSLLVLMPPVFGEPILLPVSHRLTDITALRKKSTTKVIENNKTVVKPICIKKSSTKMLLSTLLVSLQERSSTLTRDHLKRREIHSTIRGFSKILICLAFCNLDSC